MSKSFLSLNNVSFHYGADGPDILRDVTFSLSTEWTAIVGANGCGKSTLLKLITGELSPTSGTLRVPTSVAFCPQRTEDPGDDSALLTDPEDTDVYRIMGMLGVDPEWCCRWESLSHGERKRIQVAIALSKQSDILLLDEPTNHVDHETRSMIEMALSDFHGIGLLVSHDRDMVDRLCAQTIYMQNSSIRLVSGGYTTSKAVIEEEEETQRRAKESALREFKRVKAIASNRRREADRADKRRSKRNLDKKDHDAKARIDSARVSGKDGQAGRLLRQMHSRLQKSHDKVHNIHAQKTAASGMSISCERSRQDSLFKAPPLSLPLGNGRTLTTSELTMRAQDRVGIVGPNGAGKTTLLRYIREHLTIDKERVLFIPQEVSDSACADLLAECKSLKSQTMGEVISTFARLGSDPERVLGTEHPSPGEVRKLMLALGIVRQPMLIILDEPTNHLDVLAVEALEEALGNVECGLLVVSHDERFLTALKTQLWSIEINETQKNVLKKH